MSFLIFPSLLFCLQDIEVVINFDFPNNIEDYVHRIGRTGRGLNGGTAFSLMTRSDSSHVGQLVELLQRSEQV